jgi:hypothetical protein
MGAPEILSYTHSRPSAFTMLQAMDRTAMRGQARPAKLHHAPAMRAQQPLRSRRMIQICLAAYEKVSEQHPVAWTHHSWTEQRSLATACAKVEFS